jgi:hypothetical protein
VILSKEVIQRLITSESQRLLLIESPDGAFHLRPPNRELEKKMRKAPTSTGNASWGVGEDRSRSPRIIWRKS